MLESLISLAAIDYYPVLTLLSIIAHLSELELVIMRFEIEFLQCREK